MSLIMNILLGCPERYPQNVSSKQLDKIIRKLGKRSNLRVLKPQE